MHRRRNYLIKKKFQVKFLMPFVVLLIIEGFLIAGLLFHASNDTLTTGYNNSMLKVESTPSYFFVTIMYIMLISAIGVGLAGLVVFIILSHRIAGPLFRFEKDVNEVASGDLTKRIRLRKTDQLTEIQEALNMLVGTLDDRIGKIRNELAEVSELLAKDDSPHTVAQIKSTIARLKQEINRFRVTGHRHE